MLISSLQELKKGQISNLIKGRGPKITVHYTKLYFIKISMIPIIYEFI